MIKQKYLNGELVNLTETEIIEIEKFNNSNMFEEATARENLKASAKAKLIAGQPLTEEEADTIVL
jgi:hypothetical protein